MNSRKAPIAVGAAIALAAAGALIPMSASAAATPLTLGGLPNSAVLTGPSVVSGVLNTASGAPVAAGTVVDLFAWPSNDSLDSMAVGGSAKLVPLSAVATDSSGHFALSVPSAAAVSADADSNGVVNFEIDSTNSAGQYSAQFPELVPQTPLVAQPAGTAAPLAAGDDGTDAVAPVLAVSPLPGSATAAAERSSSGAAQPADDSPGCTASKQKSYTDRLAEIGASYLTTSGATAHYVYSAGAENEIGVSTSISGSNGSFSSSGTDKTASEGGISFATEKGVNYREYRTNVNFGEFLVQCITGSPVPYTTYEMRTTSIQGGDYAKALTSAPSTPSSYCESYKAGDSVTTGTSHAVTWTAGADISDIVGVSVSSSSGYSTDSHLTYHLTTAHHVCGTKGAPLNAPSRIVERS